jgi:hypothetical protein
MLFLVKKIVVQSYFTQIMDFYRKSFELIVENQYDLEEKLTQYFELYNFKINRESSNTYTFSKKSSLLDGWKMNPLDWGSRITIIHGSDTLVITYYVSGNSQITPIAFEKLFSEFINNLNLFINGNQNFTQSNALEIALAKQKLAKYYLKIFLGITFGFIIGFIIENLTGTQYLRTICVFLSFYGTIKLLNHNIIINKTVSD